MIEEIKQQLQVEVNSRSATRTEINLKVRLE